TGNPIKEILLKMNLPDHRSVLTDPKDTDIQEKEQKESQNQQIQARNGKDKVKGIPSEENTT
ncbi:hypothetical protein Tco_0262865, partial [Tanacetum coccineum]